MEDVIDIRTMKCYREATEAQKKKSCGKSFFQLNQMPTEQLMQEWGIYIKDCGERHSLSVMRQQTIFFNRICEFINSRPNSVSSMKDQQKKEWERQFEDWMTAKGLQVYRIKANGRGGLWRERTPMILYLLHMLDFINSKITGQRIYLKDLPCYQRADEEQRKKCGKDPYFDLSLLQSEQMRQEWDQYIKESSETYSLGTFFQHRVYYNQVCRFLNSQRETVKSMRELSKEEWIHRFKRWLMAEGLQVSRRTPGVYQESFTRNNNIAYLERMLESLEEDEEIDETLKDIWELERLPITIKANPIKARKRLNFTGIQQPDMRSEVKKGIYMQLQKEAISTVLREMTVVKRLTEYLREKYPQMRSLGEVDRSIFEEYLIHLKTDETTTKLLHTELARLRALLETIGKLYGYPQLENLIINRDIPPTPRAEFKSYSDEELKRLNGEITKMDEQVARLMVIHQMLGTRISDTLTLRVDCIREQRGEKVIRIRQMKTHPYEKPISEELAMLIEAAIRYTKGKYGETDYIFVQDNNPEYPMQYNWLQNQIVRMIRKENLRDDDGKLFGFGTHMYRHFYGVKLTEMHLDDWTIARLLGHSSVQNVKYYRRMSNQILADETRQARERLSRIILENLDGWGEEYEQIRYDAGIE